MNPLKSRFVFSLWWLAGLLVSASGGLRAEDAPEAAAGIAPAAREAEPAPVEPDGDAPALAPAAAEAAPSPVALIGEPDPAAGAGDAMSETGGEEDEEEDEYAQPSVYDPFERFNRTIFKFNDGLYRHVVRPVSRGYETITPKPVRRGLVSFFDNIRYPVRFAGCVLQGKFDRAAAETGKFVVNTTAGLGGFIKVSDKIPALRVDEEDVGQAFGAWGVGPGPFLMLPVFGPSNVRDLGGMAGDYVLTPLNWPFMDDFTWEVRDGLVVLNAVSNTPDIIAAYDVFNKSALDPYVALRNGYMQYRQAAVKR